MVVSLFFPIPLHTPKESLYDRIIVAEQYCVRTLQQWLETAAVKDGVADMFGIFLLVLKKEWRSECRYNDKGMGILSGSL